MLEQPTNVELQEAVASFDFGWGTGKVWRVTKVNKNVEAPDEMFIRIRE
jgi:1,4-dihydroxy-2-naphthoyl-CoA synthase